MFLVGLGTYCVCVLMIVCGLLGYLFYFRLGLGVEVSLGLLGRIGFVGCYLCWVLDLVGLRLLVLLFSWSLVNLLFAFKLFVWVGFDDFGA